ELPYGQPGNPSDGRNSAARYPAADVRLAVDARPVGSEPRSAGPGHCLAVGDSSAANGVGDIYLPTGRIPGWSVLFADLVLFRSRGKPCLRGPLACRGGVRVPAGNGQ